jgi:hypothetical protein
MTVSVVGLNEGLSVLFMKLSSCLELHEAIGRAESEDNFIHFFRYLGSFWYSGENPPNRQQTIKFYAPFNGGHLVRIQVIGPLKAQGLEPALSRVVRLCSALRKTSSFNTLA